MTRTPVPTLALFATLAFWPAGQAGALPEGYGLDGSRAERYFGFVLPNGGAQTPALMPAPGWALVKLDDTGFQCMRTAPLGTAPLSTPGPLATGSSYESLGRPERLIEAAPGVPTTPIRALLSVNPSYNVEGFTHGLMTFDCEGGVTERRGLFLPTTVAGREVLFEPDTVQSGLTLVASLQVARSGDSEHLYARIADKGQHPDFPYAHPFNHLVRWPLASDGSAPEVLVSSRDLVERLMDERELGIFGRYLGWSLRIQSFLPLPDGSLWFVVDLDNDRGSRDVVPRSFLFRRAPTGEGEELRLIQTIKNPPQGTGSGPSRLAMERLIKPGAEPLIIVGTAGVVSTEASYRFTWTPPGDLVMRVIPGHDGYWGGTSDPALAPVVFDPALADFDGDLLSHSTELTLGTSDLAFDTDGDGLHDRREHLDATLDPLVPAAASITEPHTRWGVSTRIQTAWFARPDRDAWNTTPYFDGRDPDGADAPRAALRYTPDGLPTDHTSGWALSENLAVDSTGWVQGGVMQPFAASWPADATPLYADEVTGPITWLGPDDVHGAAFVHIPRAGRQPIYRLYPDQRLELLFDASWYGLDTLTSMLALTEHDTVLASIGGAYGGVGDRRHVVFDAGFAPHSIELRVSPSHSRVARFFGIGYGLADQLDPFAGGYATHWIAELVAVDDRVRPGDIVAAGDGLFVLREDLTAHRWLKAEDLLALADETAREALLERWGELLYREVVPPLAMFPIDEVAVADDASSLAFVGEGALWIVALSDGRAVSLSRPIAEGVLGVAYIGREPVVLRRGADMVTVEALDGTVLATTGAAGDLTPWRLARLGPIADPTWVVFYLGGQARCVGPQYATQNDIANAVMSPFSEGAVVWMRGDRVVAGSVAEFCGGSHSELVDRFGGDEGETNPFQGGLSFWKEIARMSCRFSSGGSAAYTVETLPVETADLALRPDGGVLVSPRSYGTRCGDMLTNPLGGTPFFLGAFFPTDAGQLGLAAHAPYRREFRGPRIGVPITSLQAPFLGAGPMARVPGPVSADWGHIADMSHAGRPRPEPWTPPEAEPEPENPEPEAKPAKDDDGGCAGSTSGLFSLIALVPLTAWGQRRRRGPAQGPPCSRLARRRSA